ncbi:MAG: NAD(+) synthase [Candidatus Thorarchaeota archaeon]
MANLDIFGSEEKIITTISNFIEIQGRDRGVDGVLILFSGYIDSTIVARLSLDIFGKEKVKLFVRMDRFNRNQAEILTNSFDFLGVDDENIESLNIDPIVDQLKTTKIPTSAIKEVQSIYEPLSYDLLKITMKDEILEKTYGMIGSIDSERERQLRNIFAHNKLRSRIHMAAAHLFAEQENRLILGSINKTEIQTGLFTKWGYGHCSDLLPLGDLYRTQILQLAEKLEIPHSIRDLAKADLVPGIKNKYLYFFNLDSSQVDTILMNLSEGLDARMISRKYDLEIDTVKRVDFFYSSAPFSTGDPMIPKIEIDFSSEN